MLGVWPVYSDMTVFSWSVTRLFWPDSIFLECDPSILTWQYFLGVWPVYSDVTVFSWSVTRLFRPDSIFLECDPSILTWQYFPEGYSESVRLTPGSALSLPCDAGTYTAQTPNSNKLFYNYSRHVWWHIQAEMHECVGVLKRVIISM